MFAAPRKKQRTAKPLTKISKPVFTNSRLNHLNREIMKKTSHRTFKPFVIHSSDNDGNSRQRSLIGSQQNDQTKPSLTYTPCLDPQQNSGHMRMIDISLRQILATIRRQKSELSMIIMRMKSKAIECRKLATQNKNSIEKQIADAQTDTDKSIQLSSMALRVIQKEAQTEKSVFLQPEQLINKKIIEERIEELEIDTSEMNISKLIIKQGVQVSQEDQRIRHNKMVIQALLGCLKNNV